MADIVTATMYDLSGNVIGSIAGHKEDVVASAQANGFNYIFTDSQVAADTHYISNGAVVPKAASTVKINQTTVKANGTDSVTLTGLPVPCTISINGKNYDASDASADLTFNYIGSYTVKVNSVRQLPATFNVTAS